MPLIQTGASSSKTRRWNRLVVAARNDSEEAQSEAATSSEEKTADDDDDLQIERQLTRRSTKRRKPPPQAVSQSASSAAKAAQPEPPASQTEALILQSLGLAFVFILLEGLALAASGFLPEAADQFITDVIYPTFSAQLGVVFACSTVYGLWKTSAKKEQ